MNKDLQGQGGEKSETTNNKQEGRQPEQPMEYDPDKEGRDDDKASVGGASTLVFNFLDEDETKLVAGTTEPAEDGASTLPSPSAFTNAAHNFPEGSSTGKIKFTTKKLLSESPRRRKIEGAARVPFLRTLPEEAWKVHHRDHESKTGCVMDRIAFMEEVWPVSQCNGTLAMMKTGLNNLEILYKLDECEGRISELRNYSAIDKSEISFPIKMTHQESNEEMVYLSRS